MDPRQVFVEVVERGSFTDAAEKLGISVSYASRRVRDLEDELGVPLLARTTRRVEPTETGRTYYEQLSVLLRDLADLDKQTAAREVVPRGHLRIALPYAFGLARLSQSIHAFLREWPEVRATVSYSDALVDPLDYDVTVRGGQLADSSLSARHLVAFTGRVVASPAYLAAHGTPTHPQQLAQHMGVTYTQHHSMRPWTFHREGETLDVHPQNRLQADSGEALVAAALDGLGLAYQPSFLVDHHIDRGALVPLLCDWSTFRGAFWALTPDRRKTAATRAFIDHLVQALRDEG